MFFIVLTVKVDILSIFVSRKIETKLSINDDLIYTRMISFFFQSGEGESHKDRRDKDEISTSGNINTFTLIFTD
jgi:hypothetical protein